MLNKKRMIAFGISTLISLTVILTNSLMSNAQTIQTETYKQVNPLELVASPRAYLGSKIKINATFDKFSTLGLDYKPAFRDSKDYISFLIKRPDIQGDVTIPLSELKLMIKRDKAEKLIDLESGDKIEFTGQVFSAALNDPWVDVENIKVISSSKVKTVSDVNPKTVENKAKDTEKKIQPATKKTAPKK